MHTSYPANSVVSQLFVTNGVVCSIDLHIEIWSASPQCRLIHKAVFRNGSVQSEIIRNAALGILVSFKDSESDSRLV